MYIQQQLTDLIATEHHRILTKVTEMERTLPLLPDGHLSFHNNSYYRVLRDHGERQQLIIPEGYLGGNSLIRDLQEKRHIKKALPILKSNMKACEKFLDKYQLYDMLQLHEKLPVFYSDFNYSDLLLDGDIYPDGWDERLYIKNSFYPERLIHSSGSGLATRSKAEAMIATALENAGLQFRYDALESFGTAQYSPDFEVLHPYERRIIYWEHFGMMDDPDYAQAAIEKVRVYGEHGLHTGDNFIITWESRANPLTHTVIQDTIDRYFSLFRQQKNTCGIVD